MGAAENSHRPRTENQLCRCVTGSVIFKQLLITLLDLKCTEIEMQAQFNIKATKCPLPQLQQNMNFVSAYVKKCSPRVNEEGLTVETLAS